MLDKETTLSISESFGRKPFPGAKAGSLEKLLCQGWVLVVLAILFCVSKPSSTACHGTVTSSVYQHHLYGCGSYSQRLYTARA